MLAPRGERAVLDDLGGALGSGDIDHAHPAVVQGDVRVAAVHHDVHGNVAEAVSHLGERVGG